MRDQDLNVSDVPDWNRLSVDESDPEFYDEFNRVIDDENVPHEDVAPPQDDEPPEMFDNYINMEIGLPRGKGGELYQARVKRRVVDSNEKPIGKESSNPIMDIPACMKWNLWTGLQKYSQPM